MRTKRRELDELRHNNHHHHHHQSRKSSSSKTDDDADLTSQQRRRQLFADGQLGPADSYYELLKMIAGAGMGLSGGGVGMLRARRRDISIKPNRKLDRKSSRGMIYENEELRLRTIHINAEVEQGQNDIKKLRRENEQLRREIWSLRDEYDKLEEILKKQKSREESGEPEDRSDNEATESGSDDSEDDENDDDDEDDDDNEESDSKNDVGSQHDKEERLENAENQKISSTTSGGLLTPLRARLNFDDLPVLVEEEETKKTELQQQDRQNDFLLPYSGGGKSESSFLSAANSFNYRTDYSPFDFPSSPAGYSNSNTNPIPSSAPQLQQPQQQFDESCAITAACPQLYADNPSDGNNHQEHTDISLKAAVVPSSEPIFVSTATSPLTPPPPAGWQNSMLAPSVCNTDLLSPSVPKQPEGMRTGEMEKFQLSLSLAERRNAFFRRNTCDFQAGGSRDIDIPLLSPDSLENGYGGERYCEGNDSKILSMDEVDGGRTTLLGVNVDGNGPRHFFAPLTVKPKTPVYSSDEGKQLTDDNSATRHSDGGYSPSSDRSAATTVVSKERYDCEKGSLDVYVSGAVPCRGILPPIRIESGDAKAFFKSENLLAVNNERRRRIKIKSIDPPVRSMSCRDLSDCPTLFSSLTNRQLSKSDSKLDCLAGNSQCNSRRQSARESPSPDLTEIAKLPPIDYKLFSNPFIQNFEQAYQNFPLRTTEGGPSPVNHHPLSIQVSESPVAGSSYSSPVKVQPSFSGPPSTVESDCLACNKRKDFDRLRLMIPPAKFLNSNGDNKQQEYQVTSFETPSPHTLQIPPMTPYELDALRKMPTGTSAPQTPQTLRLYQNVPFVPKGAAVYCPGQGVKMYYDTSSIKVAAQTQTTLEDEVTQTESNQPDQTTKKRRSRKEKGSVKDKQRSSVRHKKQTGSRDLVPESPGSNKLGMKSHSHTSETQEEAKNESRSSSSGQESPKKEQQTKRVSLYFSTKKRPSISSTRTSRSRSGENTKLEAANGDSLDRNSISSSREVTPVVREKTRKGSTSSGSVPWCACWGNGCV